jgi:hypothetical protein
MGICKQAILFAFGCFALFFALNESLPPLDQGTKDSYVTTVNRTLLLAHRGSRFVLRFCGSTVCQLWCLMVTSALPLSLPVLPLFTPVQYLACVAISLHHGRSTYRHIVPENTVHAHTVALMLHVRISLSFSLRECTAGIRELSTCSLHGSMVGNNSLF